MLSKKSIRQDSEVPVALTKRTGEDAGGPRKDRGARGGGPAELGKHGAPPTGAKMVPNKGY